MIPAADKIAVKLWYGIRGCMTKGDVIHYLTEWRNQIERLEKEKEKRIYWQSFVYHGMKVVDAILGQTIIHGTGTCEDTFVMDCEEAIEKIAEKDEMIKDRCADLDFEYQRAEKAETEIERLKGKNKKEIDAFIEGQARPNYMMRCAIADAEKRAEEAKEVLRDLLDAFWDMSPREYGLSRKLPYPHSITKEVEEEILQRAHDYFK